MPKKQLPYKDFVKWTAGRLMDVMKLHDWSIDVHFDCVPDDCGSSSTLGACKVDQTYLAADVYLNKSMRKYYKELRYAKVQQVVAHELAHVLTEPVYKVAINAVSNQTVDMLEAEREKLTERVARIALQVLYRS